MTLGPNTAGNIASIAPTMQEDAIFAVRENYQMQNLVTIKTDMTGLNPRANYQYPKSSAVTVAETDDLSSTVWTPTLLGTLTPAEIGLQFFVTDARTATDSPDDIERDGALELGFAAGDKVETDLSGDMASLTGGTIGTAGSTITWGYVAAAIAKARNANKSVAAPLNIVLHGYQWAILAKTASIAGASLPPAMDIVNEVNRTGFVASFMGVPIYQIFTTPDSNDDFTGGCFPKSAILMDWRRRIRIEPERDASRRGTEFNMSALYAHGVWRAALGVKMIFDATAPTS